MKKVLFSLIVLSLPKIIFAESIKTSVGNLLSPAYPSELACYTVKCELVAMFLYILKYILTIIPIASVLFVIIGGFQMVSSSGNEEKILQGKRTVFWAIMGLTIAILSFTMIAVVENFIGKNSS